MVYKVIFEFSKTKDNYKKKFLITSLIGLDSIKDLWVNFFYLWFILRKKVVHKNVTVSHRFLWDMEELTSG